MKEKLGNVGESTELVDAPDEVTQHSSQVSQQVNELTTQAPLITEIPQLDLDFHGEQVFDSIRFLKNGKCQRHCTNPSSTNKTCVRLNAKCNNARPDKCTHEFIDNYNQQRDLKLRLSKQAEILAELRESQGDMFV